MKKILGISLVAVLAATPMMANAAIGDPVAGTPTSYGANQPTGNDKDAVLGGTPLYRLAPSATTDDNAASAGYVKGAYNAAIKAVNKVHDEVASITTNALTTAGNGLSKDDNTVSIDLVDSNSGLTVSASGLGVDAGNGIDLDSNGVNVKAKTNGGIAVTSDGVSVNAKTNGGLTVDSNGVSVTVDNSTISVDSATGAVKIKEGVQGTDSANYTNLKSLTTQGYVDEKVAVATDGMATTTGVAATVNSATFTQGAVTQGLTGSLTSGTILTVMTSWDDDTASSNITAVTGIGNLNTDVSVAAPTINTVTYQQN